MLASGVESNWVKVANLVASSTCSYPDLQNRFEVDEWFSFNFVEVDAVKLDC